VEFLIKSNDFKHSSSRLVGPTKIAAQGRVDFANFLCKTATAFLLELPTLLEEMVRSLASYMELQNGSIFFVKGSIGQVWNPRVLYKPRGTLF